ncbi:MAG: transcription factor S [Methanobrevibacter sp.]|jgi:DNA-directed RNA polymerase subunit M|nr:transcription factor S [Methanobrevibacter sp.]
MDFCPDCGAMILPDKEGNLKCKCGYKNTISDEDKEQYAVSEKIDSNDSVIMRGEDIGILPTTNEVCPKCGNRKAEYWLLQTRSADEAPTRFFKCTECKHTWRDYD